ncbi:MAG: hypothetical protein PHQ80_04220 [Candidatus ainarchaeum sp.]|nr:hypothetical protein [Candidatus ainarchaeum sp.]MDD5096641.1 hypothetical protein [Candidatus ainarchaeum sp.]
MGRMRVEGYDVVVMAEGGMFTAYVPKLRGCAVRCKAEEREHLAFLVARAIANHLISRIVAKQERELFPPGMRRGEKLKLEPPSIEEEP